ncbi:MAG: hypothetical protein ACWA5A_14445 [Marinibacterium sp.]
MMFLRCIRRFLPGTLALITLAAPAASALPAFSFQRAELFATCSGRLAALATHQRSRGDVNAQESQRLREEFDLLLQAVMPEAVDQGVPSGQAQRWRSQGWSEIAGYLADMHYSFDLNVSELAQETAQDRIGQCRDLLLPV